MPGDDGESASVVVWFEDNREGRAALVLAHEITEERCAHLTVLAIAMHGASWDAGDACRARCSGTSR